MGRKGDGASIVIEGRNWMGIGGRVDPAPVKKNLDDGLELYGARVTKTSLPLGFVKLLSLHVGLKGVVCEE